METPIKISFDIKSKVKMTPEIFFKKMPYMLKQFNFVLDNKNPDYIIYVGKKGKGNYQRIWYTHENVRPNMNNCDWALSFDYDDKINNPKHMRFPNYVRVGAGRNLLHRKIDIKEIMKRKKKFCAFIYAHNVEHRNKFFDMLSKYKRVDSPGRCRKNMSNIGNYSDPMASRTSASYHREKIAFIKEYKFVVAFEHTSYPGYTTEKIYHPLVADCVPIYWGNPLVHRDFNNKRFINAHEVKGLGLKAQLKYLVDKVVALDRNDSAYAKMLTQPAYPNDRLPPWVNPKKIIEFFNKVFSR